MTNTMSASSGITTLVCTLKDGLV